jgi:hypothetical protein
MLNFELKEEKNFKYYCIDLWPLPGGTAGMIGCGCIFFIQHLVRKILFDFSDHADPLREAHIVVLFGAKFNI